MRIQSNPQCVNVHKACSDWHLYVVWHMRVASLLSKRLVIDIKHPQAQNASASYTAAAARLKRLSVAHESNPLSYPQDFQRASGVLSTGFSTPVETNDFQHRLHHDSHRPFFMCNMTGSYVPDSHIWHSTISSSSLTVNLRSYDGFNHCRSCEDWDFTFDGFEYDVTNCLLIIAHFLPFKSLTANPLPLNTIVGACQLRCIGIWHWSQLGVRSSSSIGDVTGFVPMQTMHVKSYVGIFGLLQFLDSHNPTTTTLHKPMIGHI
jgi:hypothetical protein